MSQTIVLQRLVDLMEPVVDEEGPGSEALMTLEVRETTMIMDGLF